MPLLPPVSNNDHIQGNEDAPVVLVEYGDYQCPYCRKAYPIIKQIQEELGSSLKFVFRNFPLRKVHPQAMVAALASEAASLQGKYWEMHDILFENWYNLKHDVIPQLANTLGLELNQFNQDMASPKLEAKVLSDFHNGLRSGVNATPTFFVNGLKYEEDWRNKELFVEFLQKQN